MIVLGLHYGHDGAACIVKDGKLVSALSHALIHRQKKAHGIVDAVLDAVLNQASVTLDQVEARLNERDRALLHEAVFADEIEDGLSDLERAQACLAAIQELDVEARRSEARRSIKEAERSGDFDAALRWMRELERLRAE